MNHRDVVVNQRDPVKQLFEHPCCCAKSAQHDLQLDLISMVVKGNLSQRIHVMKAKHTCFFLINDGSILALVLYYFTNV